MVTYAAINNLEFSLHQQMGSIGVRTAEYWAWLQRAHLPLLLPPVLLLVPLHSRACWGYLLQRTALWDQNSPIFRLKHVTFGVGLSTESEGVVSIQCCAGGPWDYAKLHILSLYTYTYVDTYKYTSPHTYTHLCFSYILSTCLLFATVSIICTLQSKWGSPQWLLI